MSRILSRYLSVIPAVCLSSTHTNHPGESRRRHRLIFSASAVAHLILKAARKYAQLVMATALWPRPHLINYCWLRGVIAGSHAHFLRIIAAVPPIFDQLLWIATPLGEANDLEAKKMSYANTLPPKARSFQHQDSPGYPRVSGTPRSQSSDHGENVENGGQRPVARGQHPQ